MPSNSTDKALVSFINQQRYTSSSSAKPINYKQPQDEPKGVLASYLAPQDKSIQSSFKPVFEEKPKSSKSHPIKIESNIERPPPVKYVNPRKHNILNEEESTEQHSPAKLSKLEQLYAQTLKKEPTTTTTKKNKVVLYKTESSSESSSDSSSSESDNEEKV